MNAVRSLIDLLPRAHIPQSYGPLAFLGGWLLIGLALFISSQVLVALRPANFTPSFHRAAPSNLELAGSAVAAGLALAIATFLAAVGAFLLISIIPL